MIFFKKPFVFSLTFSLLLIGFSTYALLDTFVIPHAVSSAEIAPDIAEVKDYDPETGIVTLDNGENAQIAGIDEYDDESGTVTLDSGITVSIPEGGSFNTETGTVKYADGTQAVFTETGELVAVSTPESSSNTLKSEIAQEIIKDVQSNSPVVSTAQSEVSGEAPSSVSSSGTSHNIESSQAASSSVSSSEVSSAPVSSTAKVVTASSYIDDNISINISTVREYDTTIYIADIQLSSAEYLKTALANNIFGTNITAKTSETAAANNAIFAVNGDYYGANSKGYVIKNGKLYRSTVRRNASYNDLVIYSNGSFGIVNEASVSAQSLISSGVKQLLAFGPVLVSNSDIAVTTSDEVDKSMSSNPRTAIGIVSDLHYIIAVSDGRTSESTGLSLYQLACVMRGAGCSLAYNLDGGGSSTMYFNGKVINNPTTNGKKITERGVSDIVYIGY